MGYESTQPLLEQLWDVHGAERQLAKALQAVAASVASTKLATAFRQHLAETEGHLRKLEQVMTLQPVRCLPEATLEHAEALMLRHLTRRILIADEDDKLVGLITLADSAQHQSPLESARWFRALSARRFRVERL